MNINSFLKGSLYTLAQEEEEEASTELQTLIDRVGTLRKAGTLTEETLRQYYGDRRFEEVAESSRLEGSSLDAGATQLAIGVALQKGITLSGHDPAYVRDAQSLNRALEEVQTIAKARENVSIPLLGTLHGLILGDREGSGSVRDEAIIIKGSQHHPPKRRPEILDQLEQLCRWSDEQVDAPCFLRATVLHAWLTHIHPYIDGNGRLARAVTTLELVRGDCPPAIIKKTQRDDYLKALSASDEAGEISSFLDFMLRKCDDALTGLELTAKKNQGYDPQTQKLRQEQEENIRNRLALLKTGCEFLVESILHQLQIQTGSLHAKTSSYSYGWPIDTPDKYISLATGETIGSSWFATIKAELPLVKPRRKEERLLYFGVRSWALKKGKDVDDGPALFWSNRRNNKEFRGWRRDDERAPFCMEMSMTADDGNTWHVRMKNGNVRNMSLTQLAQEIAKDLFNMLQQDPA